MADYAIMAPPADVVLLREPVRIAPLSIGTTPVTTYFYRASDGSRGSTTSEDSIPAGAVVEGIVTS